MADWGRRILEEVESRTGYRLEQKAHVDLLEARSQELTATSRELDLLGWSVLDHMGGNPQELTAQSRRKWATQSRNIWLQDAQAGAAVDLMNDFVFGRGVPKPRAKDDQVQAVIDEAWDDPDNQLVLTSYQSQVALGTDLSLQSNLFLLMFEGEDGKVKLGLLNHDEVENAVRDPDNRLRVLYYLATHKRQEWDYENDTPKLEIGRYVAKQDKKYYEHWRNVKDAEEAGAKINKPPKEKLGEGRVYHVAINRTSEQVFGSPTMRRLHRWFSAYNDFMAARVDMAQAAAAFIMRRKIKGTPNQVARMAAKAISRRSELAGATGTGDNPAQMPPRGGSILNENENVSHENLSLNSNAGAAAQDAQMIRANISAAIRFPQSYLGDATNSNLATATSLELPVLKAVESRQEVFEGAFRWFLDRVIETAVEKGRIDKKLPQEEQQDQQDPEAQDAQFNTQDTGSFGPPDMSLQQSYEDQGQDEADMERDLSYEFSMPSPLRRMMADLVGAIANIAKTFDPNATNMELSRVLLNIALGEGLEVQDPSDAVDRIFPEGYEDPAVAAAQQAAQQPPPGPPDPNAYDPNNPYGAPGMSTAYQNSNGQNQMQQAVTRSRDGDPIVWATPAPDRDEALELALAEMARNFGRDLQERRIKDEDEAAQARLNGNKSTIDRLFDDEVVPVVTDALTRKLTEE